MEDERQEALKELRELLLPLTKDAVDDPEEIMNSLSIESEKYVAALGEAIERPIHVVNNSPLLAGKEHPLFPTIKSEFSDAICEGVNSGKSIGLIHEARLNTLSNEHADKVISEIRKMEKG